MLVKIGNVWVDPTKVEAVDPIAGQTGCNIVTGGRSYRSEVDSPAGNEMADKYAIIINTALQTQTFGGGLDEETAEVKITP